MGIYVGLSLLVLLLLFLARRPWRSSEDGGEEQEVQGCRAVGGRGLSRRSFVGLGAAVGAAVVLLGRLRPSVASVSQASTSQASAPLASPVPAPALLERGAGPCVHRLLLPVGSGRSIPPNTSAQITTRPSLPLRPDRMILAQAEDWWIEDIQMGGASQLAPGSGGVPGAAFACNALDTCGKFPTLSVCHDLVIQARYVGPSPEGAPFVCAFLCDAVLG